MLFNETFELAKQARNNGEFPLGYRIISKAFQDQKKKLDFRKFVLKTLIEKVKCDILAILQTLKKREINSVIEYIIDE